MVFDGFGVRVNLLNFLWSIHWQSPGLDRMGSWGNAAFLYLLSTLVECVVPFPVSRKCGLVSSMLCYGDIGMSAI